MKKIATYESMAVNFKDTAKAMEEIFASSQEQLGGIELIANSAKELFGLAEDLKGEISQIKIA